MSDRARGGNRGGCGGGYERTSENYNGEKLRRLRADYQSLGAADKQTMLKGLSRFEQKFVQNPNMETPQD